MGHIASINNSVANILQSLVINPNQIGNGQRFFGNGEARVFYEPGTFQFIVPPGIKRIRARCIGAGGSGASQSFTGTAVASGGGGGGYSEKIIDTTPGTIFSLIVAAGGLPVTGNSNGNPGGTSSFGVILSSTGGQGGLRNSGTENSTVSVAANTGGNGVGGDVNYTGGPSGAISNGNLSTPTKPVGVAGGGGSAATWQGNGVSSGDILFNHTTSPSIASCASGGAGIGGNGGLINFSSLAPNEYDTSGGGTGSSGSSQNPGFDVWETSLLALPSPFNARFIGDVIFSAGGARRAANASIGPGGGSGATSFGSTASPANVSRSGYFSGTGGLAATILATIGKARSGGGGGGIVCADASRSSGEGGNGLIIVEW